MKSTLRTSSDGKGPQLAVVEKYEPAQSSDDEAGVHGTVLNASGHAQEVDRNFNLLSLAAMGIVTGNMWAALGGSILVAIYNGGAPGVIFEFLAVTICYCFVYASIAELASAIPSSAGVYHWASVAAGPRYGKSVGFFAGWWNFLAWGLGSASMASIAGNIIVAMYALFHPEYHFERWHVFIVFFVACWSCCLLVAFANRALPTVNVLGLIFIVGGGLATILCLAIIPGTSSGNGYATNAEVFTIWENLTGYQSNGFAFLAGMLNGAYAAGTPDVTSHLSEEIPNPRINVPKAMAAQLIVGFVTAFAYLIALFYSVNDINAIFESRLPFPLAAMYEQATNSRGGAMGLLFLILFPILCTLIGAFITAGRILWTLARDDATPFSRFVGRIDAQGKNPRNATLLVGCLCTVLGCIYIGSLTAFNAFVGSFILLSTLSYVSAILPNLITKARYIVAGPFRMSGVLGYAVRAIACTYIIVFIVIFCFPYSMPVTADLMNYTVVIVGGFTILMAILYLFKRSSGYMGPAIMRQDLQATLEQETKHGEVIR